MKFYTRFLAFLMACMWPGLVSASFIINPYRHVSAVVTSPFTLVSHLSSTPGINGGTTASFDSTAANLVAVSLKWYGAATPTVTDNKGNGTYTGGTQYANGNTKIKWFYIVGAPTVGTGHTITVGSATGSYCVIDVFAFSGAAASPFHSENGGTASNSPIQPGAVTPATSGSLVLSHVSSSAAGASPTINDGFTSYGTAYSGGANIMGGAAYRAAAAASVNPTWSSTGGTALAAGSIVFSPAP